jgi:hypothetical protein
VSFVLKAQGGDAGSDFFSDRFALLHAWHSEQNTEFLAAKRPAIRSAAMSYG